MGKLVLSAPQHTFLKELNTKFRAYVGGFGSGKTYVGCLDLLLFAMEHPGVPQGYFGPTYGAIRDIFYPTFEEAAEALGIRCDIKRGDKEVYLYRGTTSLGKVICRSMDNPGSIVGFKVARGLVDEIDTLPMDKATLAWRKIIARLRYTIPGVVNSIGVTCTPEGFLFVYDHFKKNPTKSYSMVQASTMENEEFLPDDYIPSLYETYPSQLVDAYVNGEFVNLTAGSVYYAFDRERHNTHYVARPREPLLVGMDFNVYKMAAIIHVVRKGIPYAVDEIIGARDTPDIIEAIQERYPDHPVTVYPDASGDSKSSKSASSSDFSLLKEAKFTVRSRKANPQIKNRVQSVNKKFEDDEYFVNVEKCPNYTEALEHQVYDEVTGLPDKSSDLDHPVDAGGYLIFFKWPVKKRVFNKTAMGST